MGNKLQELQALLWPWVPWQLLPDMGTEQCSPYPSSSISSLCWLLRDKESMTWGLSSHLWFPLMHFRWKASPGHFPGFILGFLTVLFFTILTLLQHTLLEAKHQKAEGQMKEWEVEPREIEKKWIAHSFGKHNLKKKKWARLKGFHHVEKNISWFNRKADCGPEQPRFLCFCPPSSARAAPSFCQAFQACFGLMWAKWKHLSCSLFVL